MRLSASGTLQEIAFQHIGLLDFRPGGMIGRHLPSFLRGEQQRRMMSSLQHAWAGNWLGEGSLYPGLVLLLQGAVILLLGYALLRKSRIEAALQRSEAQFRQIVASSPIGICVVSNRRFVYVNQSYVRMFGYAFANEIVGRPVEELYTPEERKRQRRFAKDRPAGKPVPRTYETKGLRKDGSHFDVVAWVSLIEYDGVPSSLGFVIDRSEEKQLRRQLEQANRLEAIGTLTGGIAHDFNNILTAIMGYAELVALRAGDNPAICDDLHHMQQAGKRAKELIRQILTFSSSREGRPQLLSIASIVREVLGLVRVSLPGSVEIRTSLEDNSLIYGNPTQIHQLLMNLCANAEYAMRGESGVLEIGLSGFTASGDLAGPYPELEAGRYVRLAVADTGRGVDEDLIDKIFEPFFTTKNPGEGTGMGLAQVNGIVKSHGGLVRVERNVPSGARFVLFFPSVSGAVPLEEQVDHPIPTGTESILVVDDDEMVAGVMVKILADLGYTVQDCRDGLDALYRFTARPDAYDLVISDVSMPGMSGVRLAEAMFAIRPDLPFILCSGFRGRVDEEAASRLGVRAFLDKPVGKVRLAETVRNILDEAAVEFVASAEEN